ncbi:hypothetical protein HB662_23870 [Roseomonas frigidaquae]|uniref:VPLPA-CTERM sorting domain-containing protein n=1 Tax=Falsiroseomonas frigidaquae TaxID=487318 RepID=A0ABX1F678_9PROT|nr:hypothetical protein [Falsiroseomonas frigidaquae]NKE47835.1 hypothetical protein [Falsiroseomonas frigidaquae]
MRMKLAAALGLMATIALPLSAGATVINFDDQGITGPSTFAAASPSPQTIVVPTADGNVTFEGGVVLANTTALPANQTSLYGTAYFGNGLSNPITLTFENAITNFLIDVVNGLTTPIEYTVADNLGNSSTFTLPSNAAGGITTIGFAAAGTVVTVSSVTAPTNIFDFFVDNITFNVPIECGPDGCTTPPVAVPVPAALPIFAMGLLGLGLVQRRRGQSAA